MRLADMHGSRKFGMTFGLGRVVIVAVACLFIVPSPSFQQTANGGSSAPPNFSGFWEMRYDSRNIPKATLTHKAALLSADEQAKSDQHVIRWCILVGMPMMMDGGSPIDIEQDDKRVGILSEIVSGPRTVYLDGRKHPNMDLFDNTTVGDSIGRWEGDTLVVDTVGFSDKGITSIPGGGVRTPDSHLVERYRLLDGGKRLLVTSTWTDAKVFAKPHTYAFLYYRAAPGYRPRDTDCDASDKLRSDFLEKTP